MQSTKKIFFSHHINLTSIILDVTPCDTSRSQSWCMVFCHAFKYKTCELLIFLKDKKV